MRGYLLRQTFQPISIEQRTTTFCELTSYSPTAKVCTAANIGTNNLTITIKDFSGNEATCVSVLTVVPFSGLQQPPGIADPSRGLALDGFTFNLLDFKSGDLRVQKRLVVQE